MVPSGYSETEPEEKRTVTAALLTLISANPLAALFGVALLIMALALGSWVIALSMQNRVLRAQLSDQQHESGDQVAIQTRLDDARRQMSQIKDQIDQQQTEQALNDKESLAAENARLIEELNALSKPQISLPLAELEPASVLAAQNATETAEPPVLTPAAKKLARATDNSPVIAVPFAAEMFTVILRQSLAKGYPNYLLELLDRKNNKVIWSSQRKPAGETQLSLTLARRNYPAGKYRIRLSGMKGKKREATDSYDFQVQYLEAEKPKGKVKK
jgi:hypothetical protein